MSRIEEVIQTARDFPAETERLKRGLLEIERLAHDMEKKAAEMDHYGEDSARTHRRAQALRLAAGCMWEQLRVLRHGGA